MIAVGDPLSTIAAVKSGDGFSLSVEWKTGPRAGHTDTVDLAPQILTFKAYRPLRDDPALFARVAVSNDGTAVVWPDIPDLEVSSDAIEELAEQTPVRLTRTRRIPL